MNKGDVSNFLRKTGLLPLADNLRFRYEKIKNRNANNIFKRDHPRVALPPDYLLYESFQLNYRKYYTGGDESAQWLAGLLERHSILEKSNILDWGCGPGRIIRHLGKYVGEGCNLYGTDYNRKSIGWCTRNLPGIEFNANNLTAELPWHDNHFDVIYGLSIFTHLSKSMHLGWYRELRRVLKPGGIFLFTTQGGNFTVKLAAHELERFNNGELVVRGKVYEGHRTYSAFHPIPFIREMIGKDKVLEHIVDKPDGMGWLPQDVWIVQKTL